jgi:hypothetical protein
MLLRIQEDRKSPETNYFWMLHNPPEPLKNGYFDEKY